MDHTPVLPTSGPLFRNVYHGQIQHFQQTVIRREYGFGFRHLAELPVEPLNCVGGIDQPADFLRAFEIGTQIRPVGAPGLGDLGVFLVPSFGENIQSILGSCFIHRCVYSLQIGHECFQILIADILTGISELVDDAVLDFRLGKHCFNGYGKTGQIICTSDEDILNASVSQAVENIGPIFGTLILANPHSKNILFAIQVDADGDVHSLLYDLPFAADMIVDGIQENNGVDALQ